jgi:hypothetical protein
MSEAIISIVENNQGSYTIVTQLPCGCVKKYTNCHLSFSTVRDERADFGFPPELKANIAVQYDYSKHIPDVMSPPV